MKKAYVFPGQGSQFPGMAKDLYDNNETARAMLESANEILGFRITDIMFNGTAEDLKQIRMLQSRISRLGPFDRAIVLLWLENMSYDEIGAIVGITAKNVSVRLFRIKEQLKKMSDQ